MAQSALTVLDTWLSHEWRQECRTFRQQFREWRKDDLEYREIEKLMSEAEREFRLLKQKWRKEDLAQRNLEHSRYLWTRVKESNRRDVEEKAAQLRSLSWLSALLAGFTMTIPIEFNHEQSNPPLWLVHFYAIFTAIGPGLLTAASMMSVLLLEGSVKLGKWFVSEALEEEFFSTCRLFIKRRSTHPFPPAARRTFSKFWDMRCDRDWSWTFAVFSMGVSTFFPLLGFMGFIKFLPNTWIPTVFASFILVSTLYWLWMKFRWGNYITSKLDPQEINPLRPPGGDLFDWHIKPMVYEVPRRCNDSSGRDICDG